MSIDGHNAELHEITRGCDSFEKCIETAKILKENGIRVICRVTLHKYNYKFIKEIYNYIRNDLNIKEITFNEVHSHGRASLNEDLILNKTERVKLFTDFLNVTKDKSEKIKIMDCDLRTLFLLKNLKTDTIVGGKLRSCVIAYKGIHILENGNIIPCDMMTDVVIGNIKNINNLTDLWKNNPTLNEIRERAAIDLSKFEKCKDCRFINYCTGSCPAQDYEKTKTFSSNSNDNCLKTIYEEYEDILK